MSGTTNTLIEMANCLYRDEKQKAIDILQNLELNYYIVISELYATESSIHKAKEFIQTVFTYLRSFVNKDFLGKGKFMSTEVATEGYNLTVVKHPFYVRNTIDLIRRLQPGVKTIALISDDRYISTMVREEVSSVLKKDFPELGLDLLTSMEMSTEKLLDTLMSEAPALTHEQQEQLFHQIEEDYQDILLKADRMKAIRQDQFFNALQVKFAYAVTCHKAQGGQWAHVYVDQGYMTDDMLNPDYIHWLYTAFTRATEMLYLVNWPETQTAQE